MNTALKIAVVLSAVDNMSAAINAAVNGSTNKLNDFAKRQQKFTQDAARGFALMGTGQEMANALRAPISAYADLEKEQLALKSTFLKDGGGIDAEQFERVAAEATRLGNLLPGTTADFIKLFRTMKENGTDAETILNGTGEAAAFLAVQLQLPMDVAGQMAARLRQNFNLKGSDMSEFMDLLARIKQVGPDATEITYAFNKSSGAINAFGLTGMANVKAMGAIYAQLVAAGGGFTGETAGTSMQSVLFEMLDPKKMAAMQNAAAQYGKTLDFFDATGKFAGMDNFIFQLDKLRELGESDKFNVLSAIAGPQGKDMSLLLSLTNAGTKGFNDMNRKLAEQADLQTKVGTQLSGLSLIWEATTGTFTNTQAALGATWAPELKAAAEAMGKFSAATIEFINEHPKISKAATALFAFASAGLMVAGAYSAMAAAWAFLNIGGMFSSLSFGAFAARYYIMTSLVPALSSATTGFYAMAGGMSAALGMAGALAAGLIALYKASEYFYNKDWFDPVQKAQIFDMSAKVYDATGFDIFNINERMKNGDMSALPVGDISKSASNAVQYSPTLNFNGPVDKATADSFREQLNQHKDDIARIMNGHSNNANRLSFGSDGGF